MAWCRWKIFKKCKVWLIPTANTTTQDKIDMVDIDEKEIFRFLFREGKEKTNTDWELRGMI